MYAHWASLQDEIQFDKANKSVLHKFPSQVGRDVACSVVKHIAQNLSINVSNCDPSNLESETEVKWTMEVLCFGLSLPLSENDTIKDCVNVYCEWLSALTSPKLPVPKPVQEDPNPYAQDMLHHLLNLFVPRPGSGADLVKRQALMCHRVLRTIEGVAKESAMLTRATWETLLKFLLAANDSLLSPPTEKEDTGLSSYDIGDHLCERVLSVLFELWLLACQKCFPSPSLWKTFRKMCIYWRHHEALISQWHRVNHALTARLLKFMYGPEYPELVVHEDDGGMQVPADMDNDCIAQSWFRFLHVIQNPVDLAKPELISQTPMFLRLALESETVVDPRQHECLHKLPQIFYKAMRGVSIMVNAFLGVPQDVKDENMLTNLSFPQNRQSALGPPTPPGQRKSGRPLAVITGPLTQRVTKGSAAASKSATPAPQCLPGLLSLDSKLPLAPNRPKCNSILHLFGSWLFDAAFANVKINTVHKNAAQTHRRTNSLIDHSRPTSLSIDMSPEKPPVTDNTYEAGRAEACGTLCRIFCAHKTGEEILPAYYSRFYFAMFYGLQTDENISGPVLSNILFNSCDLLRVDLAGAQILVPSILNSVELVMNDLQPKFRISEQIPTVELRKACVHLLLSMLCLPLHFKDLEIKDILSNPTVPEQNISFIALKTRIIDLLLKALLIEQDSANTQMLLGGLMLTVQDMALCEQAEQTTIQPQHEEQSGETTVHADLSQTSVKSNESSDSSYQESSYHRLPTQSQENDTAYGLFGQATSLVCNRLMATWKAELSTALAAMELLSGLAKVTINPPNMLMCKRTVKWICDFIVYQCSRPAPYHSRDLHSMIVAAFRCLTLWLVEHNKLLYDKECLHNVLEVVELGISGSKSQRKTSDTSSVSVKIERDAKSVYTQNKASDPPKYKGEKDLMPASMRVKDAAEAVLTCIIDQVGAFPPPCGPESLFSLLDEKSLLKYAKGTGLPEHGSPFRYFVLDNSIIIGLLEQPLGNYEDPLPIVTALIRGPFGRHAWTMQLRHSPRTINKMSTSKSSLFDPGRPIPVDNLGVHHVVKHKYFPESVDKIPLTMADKSIPSLDSLITDVKMQSELDKLKRQIEQQTQFENNIGRRNQVEAARRPFPNPATECKPPKLCQEFQTARLFLSHYGFLSLEALKQPANSSLPPALVMLDTSNAGLFADLEMLDGIPCRDSDTVHVFYVKSGQKNASEIIANVSLKSKVQPQFLEFLHSLGWPVDIGKHAGWTGHVSTSWKIMDQDDISDDEYPSGTGGSVYDGRQQVLYWADVMSEIAFVVPSTETYNRYLADPLGDKSPQFMKRSSSVTLTKPRSLTQESIDKARLDRDNLGSPTDVPTMRNKRGRQPAQMMGPDTKVFVIWLENFEDHENFPAGDLLGVTSTGLDHYVSSSSIALTKSTEKDVLLIFIHALQNGLFRIHMQGQTGKLTMAIPLVDGMVVSRRCLGTMVRQTAINICKRKRLESEQYQPPHVRRKFKIQEIVKNYQMLMDSPDFYTSLFQDVSKE